ncbi:MAG: hypothetical protein HY741_11320 [Chloroflexi bacterium]|nr:hypothetical protein [Chloroflexota bacterium]
MKMHKKTHQQFAICLRADEDDMLTPRRIYQVLADESAAKSNYLRVIDDEGEDYLYPMDNFVLVEFAPNVEHALLEAA